MAATAALLARHSSRRALLPLGPSRGTAAARQQLHPSRAPASSWAGARGDSDGRRVMAAAGTGGLLLVLAATAAAARAAAEEEGRGAWCGPGGKVAHSLYVTGSASGRGLRETVVGVPQEVALPGPPARIDSVAFGPVWVAVAKEGAVYVSTAIGAAEKDPALAPQTLALHAPGGGWLGAGRGAAVVQVACGRELVYGRTAGGQVLYWRRRAGKEQEKGAALRFDGPYQFSQLRRSAVTHVAAGPDHAVFVTRDGEAWAVGDNRDGRLGIGEEGLPPKDAEGNVTAGEAGAVVAAPARVQLPAGTKIVGASCGGAHTLLLDGQGGAYACGSDFWWQCGQGETWKVTKERPAAFFPVPKKVRAFEEMAVMGVAAGGNHSLFSVAFPGHWVEKGRFDAKIRTPARVLEAWACGFGQYGSLGDRAYVHLSPPKRIRELRLMTHPEVTLPPILVACGENHSAALLLEPVATKSSGDGDAVPASKYALKGPAQGPPPPKDLQVAYRPAVYVWGHGLGAQLGSGKPGNIARPTAPQGVDAARLDALVCGFDYTGFVLRQE